MSALSEKLVTFINPKSPVAEAYRSLRTNIQFLGIDTPQRAIVVTSAGPGEGKSTTIANIAIAMAQAGKKVLLVDCDLRRPVVHKNFGLANTRGLTNILANNLPFAEVAQETEIEGLRIVTSGPIPPNPSELLGSMKMKDLINTFKEHVDFVFFDTPPVSAVTDAAVLSTQTDGVVLVLSAGEITRDAALHARTVLHNVNAHILGVVLNKVNVEKEQGYYYYYYYGDGENKNHKHGGKRK